MKKGKNKEGVEELITMMKFHSLKNPITWVDKLIKVLLLLLLVTIFWYVTITIAIGVVIWIL